MVIPPAARELEGRSDNHPIAPRLLDYPSRLSRRRDEAREKSMRFHDASCLGFPKGIGEGIIAYANEAEIDALAIDHMTDAEWVDSVLPENMPVQGNLDPLSLLVGGSQMIKSIDHILDSFKDRPHIFNLGHGITPPTPISSVEEMVQRVRKS